MKEKPYTIAEHVKNLKILLQHENLCNRCPAAFYTLSGINFHVNACSVCQEFVGLRYSVTGCPCYVLGKEKAIKRTLIAIEEYESKRG